ncbi:MAG TPA: peptidoglycan DD-metalloendopeptidase family protein [Bacteroidota bacterium]|nr:peptidoglycan DD-metalloendopeptidase family protein [Bacteroidota bacterium]
MNLPRNILLAALILASLAALPARAQQDEIKKKKSELEKLRSDIAKAEQRINEKGKKEHATLELLDAYDRQAALLKNLIRKLHDAEDTLQRSIDATRKTIADLSGAIANLKQHYAGFARSAYLRGPTYDMELLLSSQSPNQMLIRSEYLKRFTDQRRKDLSDIDSRRTEQERQHLVLEDELRQQKQLLDEKTREEKKLVVQTRKRKAMLAEIRKDKKNYTLEMNRKLDAVKDLQQLIARLIAEEAAKAAESPKTKNPAAGAFENRRGKLRWPVPGGKIVAHFGAQENPSLHTVTQNPGIDISVSTGTVVSSVADGEVSAIWWLPSFGNLLIVNHKNGYRSVYAHLGEILVNEGEGVKEAEAIAKTGEALSGPLLHFEIWKDREKLDPEQWLGQKGLSQK